MHTGRRACIPLWIPMLVIALTHHQAHAQAADQQSQYEDYDQQSHYDQQQNYDDYQYVQQGQDVLTKPPDVTLIPPVRTTLAVKAGNPAHNGQVCSTWGNFHFKTFDGDIYHFPGVCNYVFASHCKSSYEDFNIQIRRTVAQNSTFISRVVMKLDGAVVELTQSTVIVNGKPVALPYTFSGILIEKSNSYLQVKAKLGLMLLWNQEDNLLIELNEKYANQTCGLCGDFNGIPIYNEFIANGIKLNPVQFGNLQKMDGPTEECQDPVPSAPQNCTHEFSTICQTILTGEAFTGCNALIDAQSYIDTCIQDLCSCDSSMIDFCVCNNFAEYSRQCAHSGGQPLEWRTQDLCAKPCPFNMQHRECGSPCSDTCTNPERSQLCEEHCTDGCFCPPGTVYDDINNSGCIPVENCHCTYNGDTYAPGAAFASQCTSCKCTGGQWTCVDLSCPGVCSIEGGSHIATFDEKQYSFFGDCSYVFTKLCDSNAFTVLVEIRKCGLTDTETCLKGVAISIDGGHTVIVIKSTGVVYENMIPTQLPLSASNITIFKPSSFFIIANTNSGIQLEIQLLPIMQLFARVDPHHKGKTCGLCGNFNSIQTDDFKAISGVVEGTSAAFANTWKTQADCPNVKNIFENPCTLSIENEKYAQHWCGLLTESNGPFQKCHAIVNPALYHTNCLFDTCNCERSEDCMCAALSSYVRACAAKGVLLSGWRTNICTKYQVCPKTLVYRYNIDSCQPTCRSLSEPDVTCNIKFTSVDGCTCEEGTYMDENGKCVPAASCPCYYKGSPLPSGDVIHENGIMCSCTQGKLQCIGALKPQPVCNAPMVYFDCLNATAGAIGAECQKSCQTLDMQCVKYSTECVSGCVCPNDLISDGKGGCVAVEDCPCIHNEATYKAGDTIKVKCNTCTCKNRMWECTNEPCLATCSVYGDGHYISFDGKRYSFSGDCEYTLVQDHCGKNSTKAGTFRVITENIPCGTTGTTCSKTIKVFLGNYELILTDGKFDVIQRAPGGEMPFTIRYMGIYMVVDTTVGLVLMWDKQTSIFIKLTPEFKSHVCGLCGNYDENDINDFTTRSQSVVGDVLEFGNSWKASPGCPDAIKNKDPCTANPYRNSWAQKQCSIINSQVFASCHSQVEPTTYYDTCVSDACACDTGGDCECFCTAVAAYAQACNEAGVCIAWRTPSICPLFCDYYNPQGECEWHYSPCGSPCMKTCRNPSGKCLHELQGLEGCYPQCPNNKPYFDEDDMECVEKCGCTDDRGKYYKPGAKMPSEQNCQSCECIMNDQKKCVYNENECQCTYEGQKSKPGEIIYNTTDGIGGCIVAVCSHNGTIERKIFPCPASTTVSTTFEFSTTSPATTTPVPMTTSVCVQEICHWSQWYDVTNPESGSGDGDFDTFDNLKAEGYKVCSAPKAVECRAEKFPNTPLSELGQKVECSKTVGLICYNTDQHPMSCNNYQIKILCCSFVPCGYTTASTPETTTSTIAPTTVKSTTTLSTTLISTTTVLETTSISVTTPETTSTSAETTIRSTTEIVPPTTEVTTQTTCKPTCRWTEWFDIHFPSLDNKGDFETYDLIKSAGKDICGKPERIICRAEKFPEKSIDEIGQIVQCNVSFGFVCKNEEQSGTLKMCFNYQIKVYCCENECVTTTPETTTTHASTRVTTIPATSTETTSLLTTVPSTTEHCSEEVCEWSQWYDISYPGSAPDDGDFDTFKNIRAKGYKVCKTPKAVECRAERFPDTPLKELEQKVICSKTEGLICRNNEQLPPICYNYEIRIECCKKVIIPCPTTTQLTTKPVTTPATTPPTTTPPETTTIVTTSVPETTTRPTTTVPETTTTKPTSTVPETTKTVTTIPETTTTVITTTVPETTTTSPKTTASETTTTSPKTTASETTTTVTTTVAETTTTSPTTVPETTTTLTTTQETSTTVSTTTPMTTAPETTTKVPKTTTIVTTTPTTTSKVPETTTTSPTTVTETTISTTTVPETTTVTMTTPMTTVSETTPTVTTTTLPETTTTVTTKMPTTTVTETSTTTQVPETTKTLITTTVPVTTRTEGKIITEKRTTTSTPKPSTQPQTKINTTALTTVTEQTTTSTTQPITTPLPSTATTTELTTASHGTTCGPPVCTWSKWFDVDFPTSGLKGGDIETYNKIRAAGGKICAKPANIQCRAENHPDVSIDQLGQNIDCDVNKGLVCKNENQEGKYKQCYNYEIRVLCCEENLNCRTTTVPKPTTNEPTTTVTEPTTTVTTTTTTIPVTTTTAPKTTTKEATTTTTSPTTKETTLITTTKGTTTTTEPTTTPLPSTTTTEPTTTVTETTTTVTTTTTTAPVTTTTAPKTTTKEATTTTTSPTTKETTLITTTKGTTTTTEPITTPLPLITTTTELTTTTHGTTCGPPVCTWSKWFDVDFPTSGIKGGDIETYNNIRAAGGKICAKPANIQCRAENHPDVSIHQLGQNVDCDVNKGLVCKNENQVGKYKQCFNYEIRVLCCEENLNCKTTTVPTTTTTEPTTTVTKPTTVTTTTTTIPVTTTTAPETTTKEATTTTTSPTTKERTLITTTKGTTTTTEPTTTALPSTTTTEPTTTVTETTTTVTTTTTAPVTTTKALKTTTKEATTTTTSPTTKETTLITTTKGTTTTTEPITTPLPLTTTTELTTASHGTTCGPPVCTWSKWFDVDFPTSGIKGGDIETYNNIRAAGGKICAKPANIQCRAENHPDVSIHQLGQNVDCDVNKGLVCKNENQVGKYKQCFNYEIRVLCCEENLNCKTTTVPTTTTTEPTTTVTKPTTTVTTTTTTIPVTTTTAPETTTKEATTTTTSPTTKETTLITTTKGTTTTTEPITTPLPLTTTTELTTTSHGITCGPPVCTWSKWFDVDFPTSGIKGGDIETYNNIRAAGGKICAKPANIQCRAENHPDLSIDQLGQNVDCDVNKGLVCKNDNQVGKYKQCFNYEIRVLCCEENLNCKTTTVPTTTTTEPTNTITKPTTTVTTTTTTAPVTTTTAPKTATKEAITSPTTKETTLLTTTKGTTTTTEPTTTPLPSTTTTEPTTTVTETTTTVTTTAAPVTTTKALKTTTKEATTTTTSPTTKETTLITTTKGTTTTTEPITTPLPLITITTELTTTSHGTTCGPPVCTWSKWFDVDFPTSGIKGGDIETYNNIRAAGGKICAKPANIQCRAENHPDVSIHQLGQNVDCDVNKGLVCKNENQVGKYKQCFNYEIRVLCCEENLNCKTTTVPTTTTTEPTTTVTKPTTTVTTTTTTIPVTTTTAPETTTKEATTTTTSPTTKETTLITTTKGTTTTTEPITTPLPLTTTTELTTTSHGTTCGPPVCTWSKWFDVDFPTSGIKGGDIETYNNIRAAGGKICAKPANIQCRAENHPDVSIHQLGQNVDCDVNKGLVCKNENQVGKYKQCFNYEIRVLCCEENLNCKTTTVPTTTTTEPTTTISKPTTTVTTTTTTAPVTTTTAPKTTTKEAITSPTTKETTLLTTTKGTTTTTEPTTTPLPSTTTTEPTTTVTETTTTVTTTAAPVTTTKALKTTTKEATTTTTSPTTKETTLITTTKGTTTTTEPITTPLPLITTTTELTTTSHGTTCGPPVCTWSKWFDVDFPTSGLKGGDIETYNNIRAAGGKICAKPANIQCRAENHPDLSIDQVGQNVDCDVNKGLVCKNENQVGKYKQCFNYEIRVLCCEENLNCGTTTVPTTTTTEPTTTVTKPTTTVPTTTTSVPVTTTIVPQTSSLPTTSVTPCFCKIGDTVFLSGEMIYNKTDNDGCIFYAICSKTCSVERFKGPCKSTTPKPTTTAGTTPATTSTAEATTSIPTTHVPGCPDAMPPRKKGDTWTSNCTTSTCEGNNKIIINHVTCPPVKSIECENGYPPVKVFSDDGCCYHYECECVCSGWGDPHYLTFDGIYYTFLDNCTYVLVQQIIPKYDNFRILIDNYFCDAEDGLSCPHSIIIEYKTSKIVLTRELFNGVEANKIYFNGQIVNPGFEKDGFLISQLGVNMMVQIPEIEATVTFSGLIFSIKLPYSKFGNNTEGQCGTCTNDKKDECRLPNGQITTCPHMAPYWNVPDDKKQYCLGPPPTPAITPTPPTTCKPSPLCEIIYSDIFSKCHDVIPSQPFYQGCNFDACYMSNTTMQCSSLEIYASLCASKGICIDWRSKTHGACPFTCPKGKVYEPCGPLNPPTCDTKAIQHSGDGIAEGCFCPTGTKLFNSYSNVCVRECSCVGPDGMPKEPGTAWNSNCQECICEEYSLTVQCKPKICTAPSPVVCVDAGYVPVSVTTQEDPCCPHKKCICNTTYCPTSIERCPLGYELKQEKLPGDCCMKTTCVKLPGCVDSNVFYQPGAVVPRGPCELCKCSLEEGIHGELYTVECISKACNTSCTDGYTYKEKAGQCCGECTPVACILEEGSTKVIIQPGKSWHRPGNNCTSYECEVIDDKFVPITVKRTCPALHPTCAPEDMQLSDDGCCKVCIHPRHNCLPHTTPKIIRHNGCVASSPIPLTYCEGNCSTSSIYSAESNSMQHTCKCCQEVKTSKQHVDLRCPDGSIVDYTYIQVEECDCLSNQCVPQPNPTQSQQQQQEEQQQQQQEEQQQEGQIQK
ncbi:mucin-5AC [Paroedura picta]|uniref:mucin-5AC n=1 Tax=Paroedura picta TaxID=143630 RepID=UPI0040578058